MSDEKTRLRVEAALRWLAHAERDLQAAGISVGLTTYHRYFWAQQAAEKSLKSLLVFSDIDPPRTHNLVTIAEMIPAGWNLEIGHAVLVALTRGAVELRYPDEENPAEAETARAFVEASNIVSLVKALLTERISLES